MNNFWKNILPNIPKNYYLVRRGNSYPFFLFTSDYAPELKLNENLFISKWDEKKFEIPQEIKAVKDKLLKPEKERFGSLGKGWYNDSLCRLAKIEVGLHSEKEKVNLYFQKTDYEDHFATNLNIDTPVFTPKLKTIRERFAPDVKSLINLKHSKLANPLGTSVFVVNPEKMKGVIGIRSDFVSLRRGFYAVAGGQMIAENNLDFENGRPNPFRAAIRESVGEFNGYVKQENLVCLGIGLDLIYGHPNILFLALIDYDTKDIIEYPRREKSEFSDFMEVDLTKPDELYEYLDPKKISPNNAACIILSVERLLPEVYCKKTLPSFKTKLFAWKKGIFKTDYRIEIQVKPNGESNLVINQEAGRAILLTPQQTEMMLFMARKLLSDSKKKETNVGCVSFEEFNKQVWRGRLIKTQYPQIATQMMKIKMKLRQKLYSVDLLETTKGRKTATLYRISTFPERVSIIKE